VLPPKWQYRNPGDKLHKLAEIFAARGPEEIYREFISHWKSPFTVVKDSSEPTTVINESSQWPHLADFEHWMMYLDSVSYLPGDILTKVDRASMSASLETRVPLLDHRVVEFAWRLPLDMKIHSGQGKSVVRKLLQRYVPAELVDRPKMGFGVPLDSWLRGPLKEWAMALLDDGRLRREGFFEPEPIRVKWNEHLNGSRNWAYYLWDVLMFQAWYEKAGK
jgi:asparagine synthase (glutamine-hydrolysing)